MHSIDLILTLTGAFGVAVLCGYLTNRVGLSPIVGYLFAGLLVGPYTPGYVADQHLAEQLAEVGVILLMFGVGLQFFVSVGMLLEPQHLLSEPGFIAATVAVILLGKPLAALLITALFRQPLTVSVSIAVVLSQIGEFSFIVATLGRSLGLLPTEAMQTLVAAAIVSITLNPILYRAGKAFCARWTARQRATTRTGQPGKPALARELAHKSIVVGYGPVGRTVARLLRENGIEVAVLEMNLATAQRLRHEGVTAVYGDASSVDALLAIGAMEARSLIVSVAGMSGIEETIRIAKELNPRINVLVRSANLREAAAIRHAGADRVFSGEAEVALAFTAEILETLGATPEQIERERARVHGELR